MDASVFKSMMCFTIRERVAYTLAIAERAARVFNDSPDVASAVSDALDEAWLWVEGETISGDSIVYNHLWRDDETGLGIGNFSCARQQNALEAVTTALLYLAWHAYGQGGVAFVTDPVSESGEENVALTIEYASQSGEITDTFLGELRLSIVKASEGGPAVPRYYASHTLGPPIRRAAVHGAVG